MHVLVQPKAKKELKKLPQKERRKILRLLEQLEDNPFIGKKLEGELKGHYSIRIWPYRVIYQVLKKETMIIILRIAHRQGVYK